MEIACSACTFQTIGPPTLDGTPCPECCDGDLGVIRPVPIEDVLETNGWSEVPDIVFSHEVSFESFECADERRTLERAADAHMLSVIRRDAAPSFMSGGRP